MRLIMRSKKVVRFATLTLLLALVGLSWQVSQASASHTFSATLLEWPIPTTDSTPACIAVYGCEVWFTERQGGNIGCLDPSMNTVTEWGPSTFFWYPYGIDVHDGEVWFTQGGCPPSIVGKLCPTGGSVSEISPVSTAVSPTVTTQPPTRIVVKPTSTAVNPTKTSVTSFTIGQFTLWTLPTPYSLPNYISACGGRVWFTESLSNKIGMLN